jgi:hypothetical protein
MTINFFIQSLYFVNDYLITDPKCNITYIIGVTNSNYLSILVIVNSLFYVKGVNNV